MSRPGNEVIVTQTPASRAARSDTGRWYVVLLTEKGPTTPTEVTSKSQYEGLFGQPVSYGFGSVCADVFFAEGGLRMVVSRGVGPAAAPASLNLAGASGTTLKVLAKSPGAWGDDLQAEIVSASAGATRILNVYDADDELLDTSGECSTEQAIIDWSAGSSYVDVIDQSGTGLPVAVAKTNLAGGTDDHASMADADWKTALERFTADMGPGQESMPGRTTAQAYTDLRAHAAATGRDAIEDLVDTSSKSTLKTATTSQRSAVDAQDASAWTPWLQVAGTAPGTTRTCPPCAFIAALMARNDAVNSPNEPVAADNGASRGYIRGLTVAWSEDDTQELSCPELTFAPHGSINVIRNVDGVIQAYGNRTLTDPVTNKLYLQLSNVRFDMAINAKLRAAAKPFVFKKIDARGHLTGGYATALTGVMQPYWQDDDLYGATEDEAYQVETGPQVNTDETAAAGQLIGVVSYRRSPGAELVTTRVIRYAVDQPLPVAA